MEDFEAYIDPQFNTFAFANDLVLATNEHTALDLDIDTSIKKLTFDIDEVEKRMTAVASQNYQTLVSNFQEIEQTNTVMKQKVTPLLERVNTTFQNVKTGLLDPYDDASNMNAALKRVHTTLDLLRGCNFLMLLILQVEDLSSVENDRNTIKLAKIYRQIDDLYASESGLLAVKFVRDYQSIYKTNIHKMTENCIDVIVGEFNHSSKFTSDNKNLQNQLICYYILHGDKVVDVVDRTSVLKQVNSISGQMSKSLQSPRNFITVVDEIRTESEQYLDKLTKLLQNCEIYDENETLYGIYSSKQDLRNEYWQEVSERFKKSIASTMTRGGPIAKNLRIYHEGMEKTFKGWSHEDKFIGAMLMIK